MRSVLNHAPRGGRYSLVESASITRHRSRATTMAEKEREREREEEEGGKLTYMHTSTTRRISIIDLQSCITIRFVETAPLPLRTQSFFRSRSLVDRQSDEKGFLCLIEQKIEQDRNVPRARERFFSPRRNKKAPARRETVCERAFLFCRSTARFFLP